MRTSLFNYHLPEEQIAQHSIEPRDHSRLMLLDRKTGEIEQKTFYEIVGELRAGDVLVFNDTKVFRARLKGSIIRDGDPIVPSPGQGTVAPVPSDRTTGSPDVTQAIVEFFLLRARHEEEEMGGRTWEVMVRPGKKVRVGSRVLIGGELSGEVRQKEMDGTVLIEFDRSADEVVAFANAHGEIPVPPYVKEQPTALEAYQTVYARETGSVAAPTAGFHFTERLLDELKRKGIQFEFVTLHVGIGTFRPVKSETLEAHEMHSEFVSVSEETAKKITRAKQEGRRIIAVGTTTVRTLEGVGTPFRPFTGEVNLFIKPGFTFKMIDGLITNFHLPKSTLLVLVSAFAGREHVLAAYQKAVDNGYRFFSFGDAMFIR